MLTSKGYFDSTSNIIVEKQMSDTPRIQKLLSNASKKGSGVGRPEFIIHSTDYSDFLIVIECKASIQKHVSKTLDCYSEYAVDGALLYASFLSKEFDVLAIAVSGQTESELKISHYLHLKKASEAVEYTEVKNIVSLKEYYDSFLKSDIKFRQDYDNLLDFSRKVNNLLESKKLPEAQRGFLISGILLALQNDAFKNSFKNHHNSKQLARNLMETINNEFEDADLPQERRDNLTPVFSFIKTHPSLKDKDFFVNLIDSIEKNVNSFMRTHKYYDTIGQFYVEFLRYANNEKGLGIVLTPPHIAELFTGLAEINENSIVYDNCCGTSGLLISAMKEMIADAKSDTTLEYKIKSEQLFGIEFQPTVYALAVSNMILHGDGKTNIYQGDCFQDYQKILGNTKPTVGLLNPPYKNKKQRQDHEELEFVLNNLNNLALNGRCIAIVPITCATQPTGKIFELKNNLLEHHTLEAVMSMPVELFHNSKTTVVTCIMVFTAHCKHPNGKKTWFGYWRDDGFIKTKHKGRIDLKDTWKETKSKWLNAYRNREVIKDFSIMQEVQARDEWCAEKYLPTDYSAIMETDLKKAAKRYFVENTVVKMDNVNEALD
jgi:type I restriction-modification system DNA methylase subunit